MFEDLYEMDIVFIDEFNIFFINLKSYVGVKFCYYGILLLIGSIILVFLINIFRISYFDFYWLEWYSLE